MNKTMKKITISLLAIFSAVAFMLGIFFFTKNVQQPSIDQAEQNGIVSDGSGDTLNDGEYHSMPTNMLFAPMALSATNSVQQTFTVNLSVKITPTTAATQPVDWMVSFQNPESEWASGKIVTDYVTVEPTSDGANTAKVTCLKAFGEKINLMVTARNNSSATATCVLDYKQQLVAYDLSVKQDGKTPTVNTTRKTGKLVADIENENKVTIGYSYRKSDVYTVILEDSEVVKPSLMTVTYKSALATALNNVKENAGNNPVTIANENDFTISDFLNKKLVEGLSIENHNKIISAITSNYYSAVTVKLQDSEGNVLTSYAFDVDTTLIKTQGKIESIELSQNMFVFGEEEKTYTITYLRGQSSSTLGLFEIGSEHGNSRLSDGSYPTSYKYGETVTISTLKSNYGCGGVYHSGSGSPSATYRFKGWYLDWNLTQPFTGEFSAGTVGDIVLYADIEMTGSHFY